MADHEHIQMAGVGRVSSAQMVVQLLLGRKAHSWGMCTTHEWVGVYTRFLLHVFAALLSTEPDNVRVDSV